MFAAYALNGSNQQLGVRRDGQAVDRLVVAAHFTPHPPCSQIPQAHEFVEIGLLRQSNGHFILTAAGKSLADSVAEAFV